MCGIPAKKSRDRLDNGLLIDVPGILRSRLSTPFVGPRMKNIVIAESLSE
jgi:hypothetical protein